MIETPKKVIWDCIKDKEVTLFMISRVRSWPTRAREMRSILSLQLVPGDHLGNAQPAVALVQLPTERQQ